MPNDFSELEHRLTDTARSSLERAAVVARISDSPFVDTEHLLLGVLAQNSSLGAKVLADCGVTLDRAELALSLTPQALVVAKVSKGVGRDVLLAVRTAWEVAMEFGQEFIGTEHLVYSILAIDESRATRLLKNMNVDIDSLRGDLERVFNRQQHESFNQSGQEKAKQVGLLERFSTDLTDKAAKGQLDPVIGRDKEIERMITILGRRSKNNPALIGEPGVGKTAVAEGLAQRVAEGKVPDFLSNKRILQLDLVAMIAGTKYRGQFEERIQKVLNVLKKHPEIIVFLDELHLLVGAGSAEGSVDAANVLKPSLARGEIRLIGATTFDEYRKYIEKDAALSRRFQTVVVDEPTVDETVAMVRGLASRLAEHHRVRLSDDVLRRAVELAQRYVTDRRLPDKAIDVVDEAAALLRSELAPLPSRRQRYNRQIKRVARQIDQAVEEQDYERAANLKVQLLQLESKFAGLAERSEEAPELTERYMRRAVASMTDVPLAHIDQDQLRSLVKLESRLKKRIVGQDEVIEEVAQSIKRARSGLAPASRPLGSFIFLGPTGVGKTELAKVLAREVFGGDKALIKIDMSEFGEKHTSSRLVGAPAGYVGYDEGGQLTDAVRRRPYSVVLFDEIEKAHPDVLNLLLQLLEDGELTDAHGRVVSFRQTIIILTSNVGAEQMVKEAELGFQPSSPEVDKRLTELHDKNSKDARRELEEMMRPELINRFDSILTFNALSRKAVGRIFNLMIEEVAAAIVAQDRKLSIAPSAKRHIVALGYNEKYGVRPLRREIEQKISGALADALIDGRSQPGDILEVSAKQGKIIVNVKNS